MSVSDQCPFQRLMLVIITLSRVERVVSKELEVVGSRSGGQTSLARSSQDLDRSLDTDNQNANQILVFDLYQNVITARRFEFLTPKNSFTCSALLQKAPL